MLRKFLEDRKFNGEYPRAPQNVKTLTFWESRPVLGSFRRGCMRSPFTKENEVLHHFGANDPATRSVGNGVSHRSISSEAVSGRCGEVGIALFLIGPVPGGSGLDSVGNWVSHFP